MSERLRSPLAKAIFDKIEHQNEHQNSKHIEWYRVEMRYIGEQIRDRFLQSGQDDETEEFLKSCFDKADWIFTQLYHGVAKSLLTFFMSATSANGLLNRGSMFVLSCANIARLLDLRPDQKLPRLLDLGAGDGNVTIKFRSWFEELHATEVSSTMQRRLQQKNISIVEVDSWDDCDTAPLYDVITCLNLLDRCDRPLTLLRQMRSRLVPRTGLLLVALVFPVKQYVEENANHAASEKLNLAITRYWEVQFNYFIQQTIIPAGFELIRWTRVPYLCEGDFSRAFYMLSDVIMVLRPLQTAAVTTTDSLHEVCFNTAITEQPAGDGGGPRTS